VQNEQQLAEEYYLITRKQNYVNLIVEELLH